jgi:RNA polymerase sigma-70 factor (ECF subfamily)
MGLSEPSRSVGAPERAPLDADEVLRRHGELLARWTARLAGPGADVDDAVQEVMLQVHRSLHSFRGEATLTTWLYSLTRRVMLRWRRRERLRRWLFGPSSEAEPASTAAGPVALLERRQASEQLYRALDTLSEKHRTALLLFEMERLSAGEIAQVMQTKPGTVGVWLHRARARLKDLLEAEEKAS